MYSKKENIVDMIIISPVKNTNRIDREEIERI